MAGELPIVDKEPLGIAAEFQKPGQVPRTHLPTGCHPHADYRPAHWTPSCRCNLVEKGGALDQSGLHAGVAVVGADLCEALVRTDRFEVARAPAIRAAAVRWYSPRMIACAMVACLLLWPRGAGCGQVVSRPICVAPACRRETAAVSARTCTDCRYLRLCRVWAARRNAEALVLPPGAMYWSGEGVPRDHKGSERDFTCSVEPSTRRPERRPASCWAFGEGAFPAATTSGATIATLAHQGYSQTRASRPKPGRDLAALANALTHVRKLPRAERRIRTGNRYPDWWTSLVRDRPGLRDRRLPRNPTCRRGLAESYDSAAALVAWLSVGSAFADQK